MANAEPRLSSSAHGVDICCQQTFGNVSGGPGKAQCLLAQTVKCVCVKAELHRVQTPVTSGTEADEQWYLIMVYVRACPRTSLVQIRELLHATGRPSQSS